MNSFVKESEEGFVLILGLILMLVLTLAGTLATRTAVMELQIAGNQRNYQENFYQADGASQVGIDLLEQNFSCPNGFPLSADTTADGDFALGRGVTKVHFDEKDRKIYQHAPIDEPFMYIFADGQKKDDPQTTNISMAGTLALAEGAAIQMGGYNGLGRGSASAGSVYSHEIKAERVGVRKGRSTVDIHWRHFVGMEDPRCPY